jgi:hypothetical protein
MHSSSFAFPFSAANCLKPARPVYLLWPTGQGTLSFCIPLIPLETTCRREYLATKTWHRLAFSPATSAPPRRSRRLLFGAHTTGADNHRAGCQNQRGTGTVLRARTMSTEENLASASDETESDDEVHRSCMPSCALGF